MDYFFKVDRRSAMIHVFTKTPPTQGSRKVVRFMQNKPQFILYITQRTNVNIYCHNSCTADDVQFVYIHLITEIIYRSVSSWT